ncbi:hypothetical protein VP1G_08397 [Cytospora mali]|uniref:Fe2OG dioxygenase domain-containing protein n=1 Tax=Cytospora mali TaxID=578113 RepID=A0A194VBG5_CYTMA|nr:hypothetical protein VP1G_08397 [Valsa mali var. pyri (nom. inval.)]
MPPKKSQAVAENPLFKELCESVAKETHNFTFACGGSIPIVPELPQNEAKPVSTDTSTDKSYHDYWRSSQRMTRDPAADDFDEPPTRSTLSLPVDLRWDSKDESSLSQQTKVSLPLAPETGPNLARLIQDCEPATFGKGDQDVYDESYRKAIKMDPSRFSSTFNSYEVGILDTIAQTLLPTLRHLQQTRTVKAELYKLNTLTITDTQFYSAPSGKFKAHVDTPRSPDQFGSLVVCLPLAHKGGALEVRHKGKTVTFDWGNSGSDSDKPWIKWAAFYSDCEHEVLEVTEGHRLTLTYNLYIVRGNGFLGDNSPALDPATLPLYKTISDLVQDAILWENGGHIGYHCSHIYPHTSTTKLHFITPDNLKGADMAIYSIFCSLGLKVSFRPVFSQDALHFESEYHLEDEDPGDQQPGYQEPGDQEPGDVYHAPVIERSVLGADGKVEWEEWNLDR